MVGARQRQILGADAHSVARDARVSRRGAAGSTGWRPIGDRLVYRGGLPLLAGGILLCNVLSGILPHSTPNPAMERAARVDAAVEPHDVLIPSTELVPHLHFWENRPGTLILYCTLQQAPTDDRFSVLRATIDAAIERKADVLYAPGAVDNLRDDELAILKVSRTAARRVGALRPAGGIRVCRRVHRPTTPGVPAERAACSGRTLVVRFQINVAIPRYAPQSGRYSG